MIRRGGGSLTFTSSFVGYTVACRGMAAYAAAKAGLTGLTQVLDASSFITGTALLVDGGVSISRGGAS